MTTTDFCEITDGIISLRPPTGADVALIITARDEEFHKWLGPGSENPSPTACILVRDEVSGWVDYDHDLDHDWLAPEEVNIGYFVFAKHRRKGYAARAVELLLVHVRDKTAYTAASVLVHPENGASLGVARGCQFAFVRELNGQLYLRRSLI
jgi:RimJ/RimL family protein N-acetyltransferase